MDRLNLYTMNESMRLGHSYLEIWDSKFWYSLFSSCGPTHYYNCRNPANTFILKYSIKVSQSSLLFLHFTILTLLMLFFYAFFHHLSHFWKRVLFILFNSSFNHLWRTQCDRSSCFKVSFLACFNIFWFF